jgi:hypothetical protein
MAEANKIPLTLVTARHIRMFEMTERCVTKSTNFKVVGWLPELLNLFPHQIAVLFLFFIFYGNYGPRSFTGASVHISVLRAWSPAHELFLGIQRYSILIEDNAGDAYQKAHLAPARHRFDRGP